MKNIKNTLLIIISAFFYTGCSLTGGYFEKEPTTIKEYDSIEEYNYYVNNIPYEQDQSESADIKSLLIKHYHEWKNTKYKYGGTTKNGIDCSAFVQNTFKSKFNIKLPRTTKLQVNIGKEIDIDELQSGDLIFFKTGWDQRHVGIYLSQGNFLHASTKKGVTISNINSPYYSSHFWTAKRINF